jgi:uncharacterized protein YbbC (DUF1343 family)
MLSARPSPNKFISYRKAHSQPQSRETCPDTRFIVVYPFYPRKFKADLVLSVGLCTAISIQLLQSQKRAMKSQNLRFIRHYLLLSGLILVATCAKSPPPEKKNLSTSASPLREPKPAPPRGDELAAADFDFEPIDVAVQLALQRGQMPGCVVAIGDSHRVLFEKAYGVSSLIAQPEPTKLDTLYDIASLTKPVVTATSAMILVERGKIRLEDPISLYLHEFAKSGKNTITVRQLLTHTAGLPAVARWRDFESGMAHAIQSIARLPLRKGKNGEYRYSDLGFILLGEIIQRVSGQSLDQFAKSNLFDPLGMNDTFFRLSQALKNRAAPTEQRDDQWIQGDVHDPLAFRLGGVAGNAGVFTTARDLSRFARMMLGEGALEGRRILSKQAIGVITTPHFCGASIRALGWDLRSDHSSNRAELYSPRAFGHGGFTGTSLWIDPERDLFVLFLSNRVHPNGKGSVNRLAGALGNIAVKILGDARQTPAGQPSSLSVETGIDALRAQQFELLRGKRVGLVTNATGRASDGTRTIDLLHSAPAVQLVAIFTPEHGLDTDQESWVDNHIDKKTGLTVFSLYTSTRRADPETLKGIDTLVVDIQDVGTRYFTYGSTLLELMRDAARLGLSVVVLDRPNPIDGDHVEGPLQDPGSQNFVNYHRLPVRHGMTVGELAKLLNAELAIGANLTVVPMNYWRRRDYYDQTGLPWVNPSPNLRSPSAALLYPSIGLLESTNLSVGRGTDTPFELFGAPWLDHRRLARDLNEAQLGGVTFVPIEFTPSKEPYRNKLCRGLKVSVIDRRYFYPVRTGLEIAWRLQAMHSAQWNAHKLALLLVHRQSMQAILSRKMPDSAWWEPELREFLERRKLFLLYE